MWLSRTPEEYAILRGNYKDARLVKAQVFNKTQRRYLPIYFRFAKEPMNVEELLGNRSVDTTIVASSLDSGLTELRSRLELLKRCPDDMFGYPLGFFPCDQATLTALANAKESQIATANELDVMSDEELLAMPGIGPAKLKEVRKTLEYLKSSKKLKKYFQPKTKKSRAKSSKSAKVSAKKSTQLKLCEVTVSKQSARKQSRVSTQKTPTPPEPGFEF